MASADVHKANLPATSFIVPTWNGRSLLERYLPKNAAIIDATFEKWEMIVVDNGSTDGTVDFIEKTFVNQPVKLIRLDRNYGFGYAMNKGIEAALYEFTYFLNNDLLLSRESLAPLFAVMEKPDTFGAMPWQRVIKGHKAIVYPGDLIDFKRGMFKFHPGTGGDFGEQKTPRSTYSLSCAACLWRTKILRQLGGFNLIYSPAYYEDLDLSHRAWQAGWKGYSVPTTPVDHWHESTSSKYAKWQMSMIQQRNYFVFQWCNLHDAGLWGKHILWLIPNIIRETARTWTSLPAFFWAVSKIPAIVVYRRRQKVSRSDAEVMAAIYSS